MDESLGKNQNDIKLLEDVFDEVKLASSKAN